MDWAGKNVLITGASSGIGQSLALNLSSKGANVGLVARRSELLSDLCARINKESTRAHSYVADVRDEAQMMDVARTFRNEIGPVDILIANAGIGRATPATKLKPQDARQVIEINLIGVINTVASVLPYMIERGSGHLVAISSLAAYRGLPKSSAYCASKAGVSAFFESIALDLRGTGIDVTTVYPGFIRTPLTEPRTTPMPYLMEVEDATQKIIRAIEKRTRVYAFPWQLASIVRIMRFAPVKLYDRLVTNGAFQD
jgi:short-subunit dehydrogenase